MPLGTCIWNSVLDLLNGFVKHNNCLLKALLSKIKKIFALLSLLLSHFECTYVVF